MKNLKFTFVSVLLILGLIHLSNVKADILYSTGTGGYWNNPYTWTDTIVPTMIDTVFIVGPVEVQPGDECARLTVEGSGDLFGEWWSGGTLDVYGNVENSGAIRKIPSAPSGALSIYISGDIIQSGTWSCQQTHLNGTSDQYLTFNEVFSGADFFIDKITGNTIATTDLEFQGTNLHLNNKPLQVQNLLSLNSCKLHDGLLTSSGPDFELFMGGTDSYIHNLITTGIRLTGYVIIATPITVNGDLTVEGIMENYYWSWADISVNGNIINNGTIRNNNTIGNATTIELTGNITNNGTWESYKTSLTGNTEQSVTLIGDTPINSTVWFDATTGKTSYQWYKDGNVISGQTNSYLSLNPVTSAQYGLYNCLIDGSSWSRNFIVQDSTSQAGIIVNLKVFLDGPFNTSEMNTDLNSGGYIPLSQPYNAPPWNYTGTEAVSAIPNADVVDWVLIELRDTTEASFATSQTIVAQQAAFLLKDGSVVGLNGTDAISCVSTTITNNLFVVVWHRNSIGIMSAFPLTENGGIYTYDFSTGAGQAYGGTQAHKEIGAGIWGMIGADGNADGQINNGDKLDVWAMQAGSSGYFEGDFNLDGQVNNGDKIDVWIPNTGMGGQVPDGAAKGYQCQVPE